MALLIQAYTFLYQYSNSFLLSAPQKKPGALNMGILSTGQINAAAGSFFPQSSNAYGCT